VLINVEVGMEEKVLKMLRKVEHVKESYLVYGVYDLIVKVEAETIDKLKETITNIRQLKKVRSTLTMLVETPNLESLPERVNPKIS